MSRRLDKNQIDLKVINDQQQFPFVDAFKINRFKEGVLRFWDYSGRKNLPWRLTSNPWHTLLAEIMLRKTTAVQASSIYEMISCLSFKQLQEMSSCDLEALLLPLGMYRVRAKQIREIAEVLASKRQEEFRSPDFLDGLPGVGRYARNAVMCFAFNLPKPTLDTNMIRVITRVFGINANRSRAREDKHLWEFAETLVPAERCREFNWGVLDLANAVCKPHSPQCPRCPLKDICNYRSNIKNNSINKLAETPNLKQSSEKNN